MVSVYALVNRKRRVHFQIEQHTWRIWVIVGKMVL